MFRSNNFQIILFIVISFVSYHDVVGELVEMRIVDEPSSFGINNVYSQQSHAQQEETLKVRVQPANFSGPPHFRRLTKRCFSSVIRNYKYKFCPFSNVTQHEQGLHWNPYKGVLGVWQEWEIVNNTFVAMVMNDGDPCGSIYRSVKVTFMCGNHSEIVNASEPQTCKYHIIFMTPLVCHPDSMLVYPTLSKDLQKEWDNLEAIKARQELTTKGYMKKLRKIFEKAGLHLSKEEHSSLLKKAEQVEKSKISEGEFETLDTCKAEYKKLQERIKVLESQVKFEGPDDFEDHLSEI